MNFTSIIKLPFYYTAIFSNKQTNLGKKKRHSNKNECLIIFLLYAMPYSPVEFICVAFISFLIALWSS